MADAPTCPSGASHDSGGNHSPCLELTEQPTDFPIANIGRIMQQVLPENSTITQEAKYIVEESVTEFISFITSQASKLCKEENRTTIYGDDLLRAMAILKFDDYIEPLQVYLSKYRESEGDTDKRDEIEDLPDQIDDETNK